MTGPAARAPGAAQVLTFGCRLNTLESEQIHAAAVAAGLGDALIVNSCAVTGEAVRQARQAIRRARRADPRLRVVVTGCAAETEPASFSGMAEVDLVIGNRAKTAPATWAGAARALAGLWTVTAADAGQPAAPSSPRLGVLSAIRAAGSSDPAGGPDESQGISRPLSAPVRDSTCGDAGSPAVSAGGSPAADVGTGRPAAVQAGGTAGAQGWSDPSGAPDGSRRIGHRPGEPASASSPIGGPLEGLGPGSTHTRGFVAVQNGCDHGCTFCIIPKGRGASRSTPLDMVVTEVRARVAAGQAEVVLTGVDLTSYGADQPGAPPLGRLVRALLAEVPELKRLRLSSIDAAEADPELVAAFAEEPRLMPHLHLSLQSGDDLILKRMKRRHSRADALALVARLRRARPDMTLGADLIAGFPTETEAQARATRDFIAAAGLAFVHVFPFSARPGTPAARMPQLAPPVIAARAALLREAGARALRRHLSREVGTLRQVLAEAGGRGYTEHFTPVRLAAPVPRGALVEARIIGHDGARLLAA